MGLGGLGESWRDWRVYRARDLAPTRPGAIGSSRAPGDADRSGPVRLGPGGLVTHDERKRAVMRLRGGPPGTSVVGLLRGCRPSAIVWGVWSVVVDSIDRMLYRWTRPHICDEQGEIVPSFTDGNATTAPVGEFVIPVVKTAPPHSQPRRVFNALMRACGVSVLRHFCGYSLAEITTARAGSTGRQIALLNEFLAPAIAPTFPVRDVVFVSVGQCDRYKQSETIPVLHAFNYRMTGQL